MYEVKAAGKDGVRCAALGDGSATAVRLRGRERVGLLPHE
jgi:hypothetical protein